MSYLFECCEPGLNTYYTIQPQIKFEKEGKADKGALQDNEFDSPMQFVMATLQTYIDTPRASQIPTAAVPAFMTLLMYHLGKTMIWSSFDHVYSRWPHEKEFEK
jgi:hypothetical protein